LTIRTGINPGAILWKFSKTHQRRHWIEERREYEMRDYEVYYVITLTTRRARSNGYSIGRSLAPFFESIRIKLIRHRTYTRDEQYRFTAVGTDCRQVYNKEEWDAMEIDEVAMRWYNRVRNNSLIPLLDPRLDHYSEEIILEMKEAAQDDESEVETWPPEPTLHVYPRSLSSWYHPITWN
jgi:hypothetical protein